jgi:hypothetical protein
MSKTTYVVLNWSFILYEAVVFVAVVLMMLVEKRSVPAGVEIEEETPAERTKVLVFLCAFLILLVVVFFLGS